MYVTNIIKSCSISHISHLTCCCCSHKTGTCIALVLEYAFGGELYHRMQKVHKMAECEAKFYFCELACALHYLHDELNVVYR